MSQRIGYEYVKAFFESRGCVLLSTEYKNCETPVEFRCPRGHKSTTIWSNFRQGHGCAKCTKNRKMTIEQVTKRFAKAGFKILSTKYVNAHDPLEYICPKGHQGKMTWNSFQSGARCFRCCNYKGQEKLGKILREIYPDKVKPQDNLDFLCQQHVDYSVRELKLAFEYDGEQHFKPVRFNGIPWEKAVETFNKVKERDKRKTNLCQENGYKIIRISYQRRLNIKNIRKIINKELGVHREFIWRTKTEGSRNCI